MTPALFAVLKGNRFKPLLGAQFLGAFHDNLFKSLFVTLLAYDAVFRGAANAQVLTTVTAGVFILPFIIFSPLGGQLADKYKRAHVIRFVKLAEIAIAALGTLGLFLSSVPLCLATLACLGTHSALFGPSRYAILPDLLREDELVAGNAILNAVIFIAILTGTITGCFAAIAGVTLLLPVLLFACALAGYWFSRHIMVQPARAPDTHLHLNWPAEIARVMRESFRQGPAVTLAVLGIGWFYCIGSLFMAQLANYTSTTLHADQVVLGFLLTVFSVGIAAGSLLSHRLLKGEVRTTLAPLALTGIAVFSLDLCAAPTLLPSAFTPLWSLGEFLQEPAHWRIIFDFFTIALFGGLFEVPLNALIQRRVSDEKRASVLAGSALVNALFVIAASVIAALMLGWGFGVMDVFFTFALASLAGAGFTWFLVLKKRMPA